MTIGCVGHPATRGPDSTVGWKTDDCTDLPQWERPAPALASIGDISRFGVHHDCVIGVRPLRRLVTGRHAMVPVHRPRMHLDDPHRRFRRQRMIYVSTSCHWLALCVGGENKVHLLYVGEESGRRLPYDRSASLLSRHIAAWQRSCLQCTRSARGWLRWARSACASSGAAAIAAGAEGQRDDDQGKDAKSHCCHAPTKRGRDRFA